MSHIEYAQHGSTAVTLVGSEYEADVIVDQRKEVAEGVVTLTFREVSGVALPEWAPGAHIDVLLDNGLVRQYSLCGDAADRHHWRIGVLRDAAGRGGSTYVFDQLREGTRVRVRGPRNHFALIPSPRYLFIAGGIGVTPILTMVAAADAAGADWRLLYGGRQRSSMAFLDELAPYGGRVTVHPQDEMGLLPVRSLLDQPRDETLVYCCGPEPLLGAVEASFAAWPPEALRVERFAAKPMTAPVLDVAFEVVLQLSDLTLTVPPDRSILEMVDEAGVGVLSSCSEGTCGTCETPVLEGSIDHRDSVLNEHERKAMDCMMICVSRSTSPRLVLDL